MKSRRALFLYISFSTGHQRAADAIREALREVAPDLQADGVDMVAHLYPTIGRFVAGAYIELLKRVPQVWDYLYDNGEVEAATRELREFLAFINAGKVRRVIGRYRPDVVVCTQAIPCAVLANEKRRGKISLPLVGVVTDYAAHAYWPVTGVDRYLVGTDEVKRDLAARGVREDRLSVTGVPIDPGFTVRRDRRAVRQRLGLSPDRPHVLVMGGSRGLGPIDQIVETLKTLPARPQVMVVAGFNRSLRITLIEKYGTGDHLTVRGYVKNVDEYMDAADLLVTKAGGLTTTEALAKRVPMLIVHPLPGQEQRNSRYLTRAGAAIRIGSLSELREQAQELLHHPARRQRFEAAAEKVSRPGAALEAARIIAGLAATAA